MDVRSTPDEHFVGPAEGRPGAAPGTPSGRRWLVRNQTPRRLRLLRERGPIELAPLQRVRIASDPNGWGPAAQEARAARALTWEQEPVRSSRERYAAVLVVLALGAAIGLTVASSLQSWGWAAACAVVGLLSIWGVAHLSAHGNVDSWEFARGVLVGVVQLLVLVLVLVVGLGVPFTAAFYGTEVAEVFDYARDAGGSDRQVQQLLTARTVQFLLIGVLTLLPAMLYFQFDRERVGTLLDRWLHHIFRFDGTLQTLDDVDARYGRRLEEIYGTSVTTAREPARQRRRSRSPVVLATLLLGLGWVLVLVNTDSAQTLTTVGELPEARRLFEVALTPVSFAFLGAYLYALQVVLRGYVRGDLRPKTYAAISVRIVISFVLAWAVQGMLDNGGGLITLGGDADAAASGTEPTSEWILGLAFLAGVVPDTVLRYVRDLVAAAWRVRQAKMRKSDDVDELADRWPLTDLVGIDLYERTRLAEEGITNVQALAHHDVVDLTLSTRIPFERVVHWVDQAVLYEHVRGKDRTALRGYGVLTATDLVRAAQTRQDVLGHVLGEGRLTVVLAALERSDWLPQLLAWRAAPVEQRADPLVFPRAPQPAEPPREVSLPDVVPAPRSARAPKPAQATG